MNKKFKKLKQKLDVLQEQVNGIEAQPGPPGAPGEPGEQGPPGPSTGPAGGDLTGSYPNPGIAANAVGAPEVTNDSLSGDDIIESSLNTVPLADGATNANTVDDVSARSFEYSSSTGGSDTTLMSALSGLTLTADCDAGPNVEVFADASSNGSYLQAVASSAADAGDSVVLDTAFAAADPPVDVLSGLTGAGIVQIVFRRGPAQPSVNSDDVTTVTLTYHETGALGDACQVMGTALGGED